MSNSKTEDIFGLNVLLMAADEVEHEEYVEIFDKFDSHKEKLICEDLGQDLERIVKAAFYYRKRSIELRIKGEMSARPGNYIKDFVKLSSLCESILGFFWYLVKERYNTWGQGYTGLRNKNGKVVYVSQKHNDNSNFPTTDLQKFLREMLG